MLDSSGLRKHLHVKAVLRGVLIVTAPAKSIRYLWKKRRKTEQNDLSAMWRGFTNMTSQSQESIDPKQEIVNNFEWEMARIQYEMSQVDPTTEEWRILNDNFKDIYAKYMETYKLYYPEEYRENVSLSYAEETIRKEDLMDKSQKEQMAKLQENIVTCDVLMERYPVGSDKYNRLADLKVSFTKEYLELLKLSDEKTKDTWEKLKWALTMAKDLAIALIPVAVYVVLCHQSWNFESEGSYRSRTSSNLISKMAPKGIQG